MNILKVVEECLRLTALVAIMILAVISLMIILMGGPHEPVQF